MRSIVLAALALFAAAPAAGQSVSIKSPEMLAESFRALGYKSDRIDAAADVPTFEVDINGLPTTVKLMGCAKGRDCKYMALVSSYTDIVSPPAAWMQKMNDEFDLLKVGLNDRKQLYLFAAFVAEGLPRTELKRILDYWDGDTSAIADEARKAGLTKSEPAPAK